MCKVKNIKDLINNYSLKIIDVNLKYSKPFNISFKQASKFVNKSLNIGYPVSLNKLKPIL